MSVATVQSRTVSESGWAEQNPLTHDPPAFTQSASAVHAGFAFTTYRQLSSTELATLRPVSPPVALQGTTPLSTQFATPSPSRSSSQTSPEAPPSTVFWSAFGRPPQLSTGTHAASTYERSGSVQSFTPSWSVSRFCDC